VYSKKKDYGFAHGFREETKLGAINSLLKEIALDDPKEYFGTMGKIVSIFC
jgi:hypothetical protein